MNNLYTKILDFSNKIWKNRKIKGEYCMRNKKRIFTLAAIITIAIFCFASCGGGGGDKEFTVTFNLDGGNIDGITASVEITVNSGEKITNLPEPKKVDNTFDGWFTEKNGNGNAFTKNTPLSANITVFAKWVGPQNEEVNTAEGGIMNVKWTGTSGSHPTNWNNLKIAIENIPLNSGYYTLTVVPESTANFVATGGGSKAATVGEEFLSDREAGNLLSLMSNINWLAMMKSNTFMVWVADQLRQKTVVLECLSPKSTSVVS
jgi:hypothetical protein